MSDDEAKLVQAVAEFFDDPYGFTMFAFPWGVENTRLADEDGPDEWQTDVLTALGDALRSNSQQGVMDAIRMAVRSGHGVGKTALVAWIIIWFMSTRPDPQCVVTANTQQQLNTKTWRELAKWHELSIMTHWFEHTGTQFKLRSRPKTWFATAIPWSENNSEAFAGTHEEHILYLFDEASAIADIIWEVSEGAMTTPGAMWLVFGNPTKTTGRFRQCWTKFRKRWLTYEVDSRKAKMADQTQLQEWITDYGIDSDFVRVRVLGKPPRSSTTQFISEEVVERAVERTIDRKTIPRSTPRVMGADIAREGDDETVFGCRHGRILIEDSIKNLRVPDLMRVSSLLAEHIRKWRPDVCYIDAAGMGAGVYDRLVQLGFGNVVVAVYTGERALNDMDYFNKRAEMWGRMRAWLPTADIPDWQQLYDDLIGPEQLFDNKERMRLERKKDMKSRGLPSPDAADMLALTFSEPMPVAAGSFTDEDLEPEVV